MKFLELLTKRGFIPLFIILLFATACSTAGKQADNDDLAPAAAIDSLSAAGAYNQAIATGHEAYLAAAKAGDTRLCVTVGARLGRLFYLTFEPDSMYFYFDAVAQDAEKLNMYPELIMIHNTIGVFSLIHALDFENAMRNFHLGLDYAKAAGDNDWYYRLLVNVSIVHYKRNDPAGLELTREIYNYGRQSGNSFFAYVGALTTAYMHHALNDNDSALVYLRTAKQWPGYSSGGNSFEPLYATVLAATGHAGEAEAVFRHCIDTHTDADSTLRIEAYADYGKFLMGQGRYDEAARYLRKGLSITEQHHLFFYGYTIYSDLSELYRTMGDYDLSVGYLNKYYGIKDTVFNVERERSFNNLIQKYERQKAEIEMQQKDMLLMKQRQFLELACAAFVVALLIVMVVVVRNRMQNKMYQQLIIKYNAYKEREKQLLNRIAEEVGGGNKDNAENEKIKSLFDQLQAKMQDEKLYTLKNLTIEETAARLGTNRSYLSKAVNTYAGMSFNAYLNSLRIKASIKLLSDPACDTPIKQVAGDVGYATITSFYNNFIKETGIPPSKFRSESQNLKI